MRLIHFKIPSTVSPAVLVGALGAVLLTCGCETVPGSVAGSPSSDPSYAVSDAPEAAVPAVRAEYRGETVAVIPYVNKTLSDYRYLGDAAVGVLPEYLLKAGLQPVESGAGGDLDSVLEELKYGQSENVNPATAAQLGQQLGARFVFLGEVNSYRVVRPKGNRGVSISGFGINTASAGITYDLQVSGRLVDVGTRAILAADTVSHNQTYKLSGGGLQTPWGSYSQGQEVRVEQEVGGKVLGVALSRLVSQVISQLNSRPAILRATPTSGPSTHGPAFCSACGEAVLPEALFCGDCGAKLR